MFKKIISLFIVLTIVFSLTTAALAVVVPTIELNDNTVYFDNLENMLAEGYFAPQTLEYIEQDGDFYKIITSDGEKWINPSMVASYLELEENTYYFDTKDLSNPLGYFEPQTVVSLQTDGEWIRIQTSFGAKWINPNYVAGQTNRLQLTKTTYYYEDKDVLVPLGYFEPQEVTVLDSEGDFYLISTSIGPMWVNPDLGPNELILLKNTYYFENKGDLEPLGYFEPQTVEVLEQDGSLYKIKTSLGPKWIDIDYEPVNVVGAFNYSSFLDIDEYIAYPSIDNWSLGESLINTKEGESRFYIPYTKDEFYVNVKAQLSESTGNYGYSVIVLAEVDSSGKDYSGYSVQFDKGENAIVLRERIAGGESNILDRIELDDYEDSWWYDVHDFKVEVRNNLTEIGSVEILVYVDGILLNENDPFIVSSYSEYTRTRAVGIRTWLKTSAEFFSIEASDLDSIISDTITLISNTYYYENIGDESALGYFGPQTVNVLEISGEWYKISTSEGPKWIIPNVGPTVVISDTITLTSNTNYYENIGDESALGYFGPQTVNVLEISGEWYKISTSEGPKWIIPNVGPTVVTSETITLTSNTYYYENIGDDNALGYFGPQTVTVLEISGEWYKISTSEGPKWIIPNVGPTVVTSETITLTSNTYYYENIGDESALGYFGPQTVTVLEISGEWYRISTSEGPKWIIPDYGPEDELSNATINVSVIFEGWVDNEDGTYSAYFGYENRSTLDGEPYNVPYLQGSEYNRFNKEEYNSLLPNGFIYPNVIDGRPGRTGWFPNTAVVIENWDGEELVWTGPNGTATASLNPSLEKELEEGNDYTTITLDSYTYYYLNIGDAEFQGYFSPQTVTVVDQDEDGWYLIQTSVGDRWIKVGNGPQVLTTVDRLSYFDQKDDSNPLGYFDPQTFIVTSRDGDWYKVITSNGQKWININILAEVVVPVNTLELVNYVYYYANKGDSDYQGYFSPQVVNVIESDGDWYKISTSYGPKWINVNNTLSLLTFTTNTYYYKDKTDIVPKGYFEPQQVIVVEEDGDWKLIETTRGLRWINTVLNKGMPSVTDGMVMIYKGSEYELIDVEVLKEAFDLNTIVMANGWDNLINGSLYVPRTAGVIETFSDILWNVPGDIELDTSIIFTRANTTLDITSLNGDFVFHKNNSITGTKKNIKPYRINLVSQNGYLKLNETTLETKSNGKGIIRLQGSEFVKFESSNITSQGDMGIEIISYGHIRGKESTLLSTIHSKPITFKAKGYIDLTDASVISQGTLTFNATDNIYIENGYFESNKWGNAITFLSELDSILYSDGAVFESDKSVKKPYTNMIVMPTTREDDFVYEPY